MSHENHTLGIFCAVTGVVAMSVMDVVIRWLSPDYPLHEIVFVRTIVALLLTLVIVQSEGGMSLLKTRRPMLHFVRGMMIVAANMTFYISLSVMPLAEAAALFYVAPLIITALSVPLLGEQVGWRRWIAIFVGFAGVVLMSGIGTSSFRYVALFPVVAALAYALTQLLTRKLGVTEKASVMSFYISVVFLFVSVGFGLVFGDGNFLAAGGPNLTFLFRPWHWPDINGALLMVFCGVLVAIVAYMLSQAYRISEANVIAPFEYVVLPLAVLWGYLFWNEVPGFRAAIGILLIGGAGLYVFIHERSLQKRESA